MKKFFVPLAFALSAGFGSVFGAATPPTPVWKHLSSRAGELPAPNGGLQQTTAVVFDVDGDGVNDFVLGERTEAPGVIWMRRTAAGWEKYLVDAGPRRTEAGGLAYDVDGDGDPDFIVGGDYKSNEIWWYENPRPNFDPKTPWKRHLIKQDGLGEHHDQAIADFMGTGKPQLMFWNQKPKKLFLAEQPADPYQPGPWKITEILDVAKATAVLKQEGMTVCDVDADGRPDLLAGMFWFKHVSGHEFKPVQFSDHPGRVAAGWFKTGKYPQIVLAPGDGDGPLLLFECQGDPTDPAAWHSRDLLGTTVIHGHSIALGDINGDGQLDIFCAEMGQWDNKVGAPPDNPNARAWILYGDGQGNFTTTLFSTGIGFHEARVADLDGDGRLDILDKPYRFDTPRLDIWLNQGNGPAPAVRAADPAPSSPAELPPPAATEVWNPVPPVVAAPAGQPPSDAMVLFDGHHLNAWESAKTPGQPAPWRLDGDAMVCVPEAGNIRTKAAFGDLQLHLEFRVAAGISGTGQRRGNSGVFLMGLYELQVLDSYHNPTYVNGQAASIYKQQAPLVNAARPPGEWQTYDAVWIAPRFAPDGRLLSPARLTVLHNGVLVQHDTGLRGPTAFRGPPSYRAHAAKLPLLLQEHKNDTADAVAYRNIWVRELSLPANP